MNMGWEAEENSMGTIELRLDRPVLAGSRLYRLSASDLYPHLG